METKKILSLNSYKLLKETGDNLLKTYLISKKEAKDFHNYRRWIINEIIDKHNTKPPADVVLEYYNYCINNFKLTNK
jgi:hypothetical protein